MAYCKKCGTTLKNFPEICPLCGTPTGMQQQVAISSPRLSQTQPDHKLSIANQKYTDEPQRSTESTIPNLNGNKENPDSAVRNSYVDDRFFIYPDLDNIRDNRKNSLFNNEDFNEEYSNDDITDQSAQKQKNSNKIFSGHAEEQYDQHAVRDRFTDSTKKNIYDRQINEFDRDPVILKMLGSIRVLRIFIIMNIIAAVIQVTLFMAVNVLTVLYGCFACLKADLYAQTSNNHLLKKLTSQCRSLFLWQLCLMILSSLLFYFFHSQDTKIDGLLFFLLILIHLALFPMFFATYARAFTLYKMLTAMRYMSDFSELIDINYNYTRHLLVFLLIVFGNIFTLYLIVR